MSTHTPETPRLNEASAIFYFGETHDDRERRIVDAYTASLEEKRGLKNNPGLSLGNTVLGSVVDDPALRLCKECPLFSINQRYSSLRHTRMFERSRGGFLFGRLFR